MGSESLIYPKSMFPLQHFQRVSYPEHCVVAVLLLAALPSAQACAIRKSTTSSSPFVRIIATHVRGDDLTMNMHLC